MACMIYRMMKWNETAAARYIGFLIDEQKLVAMGAES